MRLVKLVLIVLLQWDFLWGLITIAEGRIVDYESDRVSNLPGQPANPKLSQFAGYVTVDEKNGRALFYWFFEAQNLPSEKPLLLWFNGGPGCSSVAYGASVELGPLRVKQFGTGLEYNKYAWNEEANLLFVESPVGVGFSYTNTSSNLSNLDDQFVAEDAYNFIVNWLRRFPMYKTREFFISGESYAGHYVPQLAELIYDRNKDSKNPLIKLKGFIVGNPETHGYFDSKGLVEYAWSHGVIPDEMFLSIGNFCDFKFLNWSDQCAAAITPLFQLYKEIDIYNVYAPTCLLNKSSSSGSSSSWKPMHKLNRMSIAGGYDPCFSPYAEDYFNRLDVQRALHANISGNILGKWKVCNESILRNYNFTVFSTLPIYAKLIKAGLRIWVYSGDTDGRVPFIGTRYWFRYLDLPTKTPWRSWYHKKQVSGRFIQYEGVTLVTVRGAGHLVPLNKPSESLLLINSFLSGTTLPTQEDTNWP